MRTLLALLVAVVGSSLAAPSAARAQEDTPQPEVTVSLTFDDGFRDQIDAAKILADHDMQGTFFITDGLVGYDAYLTWNQVEEIARAGNEIGGHTITHPHLQELSQSAAKREICDDRATLMKMGYPVTSFAYPFGAATAELGELAKSCGYNSARDVSGLVDRNMCDGCPGANSLPVSDPYRIRANSSTTTLPLLKQYVRQALTQARVLGQPVYVPLIFHHICTTCEGITGDEKLSPVDFDRLLTWLAKQPVRVSTVHEVMGGEVQPVVGTPVASTIERATGGPGLSTPQVTSVNLFGLPVGQGSIIALGVVVATAASLGFRVATRKRRYVVQ